MPLRLCRNPPSSRAGGSESARLAEVGAEESATLRGVQAEDRWVAGSEEAPEVLMEEGVLLLCLMRGQR